MNRHRARRLVLVGWPPSLLLGGCATAAGDVATGQPSAARGRLAAVLPRAVGRDAVADGHALVEGYITNVWGFTALNLQLLVTGYDASGQQTGQLIAWGPSEIDYGARVYFNVPVPAAASYDVAIFAWTWVQTGNGGDLR